MITFIYILSYVVVGWCFTYWFIHVFLDIGKWSGGQQVSGFEALIIHLFWLPVAVLMGGAYLISSVLDKRLFSRIYGLDTDND